MSAVLKKKLKKLAYERNTGDTPRENQCVVWLTPCRENGTEKLTLF